MDPTQEVKNQVESAQQYLKTAQQNVHQFVEQQRKRRKLNKPARL